MQMTKQDVAKPLWTWKEETTDRKNGGKRIVLMLAGRDYLTTVWYPPWRNSLERDNATHICQTLNAEVYPHHTREVAG